MVTNFVFNNKLRLCYMYHQEEDYTDTLYLKSARQVVLSREKCVKLLPSLNKGYICASADKQHSQDLGYAAV